MRTLNQNVTNGSFGHQMKNGHIKLSVLIMVERHIDLVHTDRSIKMSEKYRLLTVENGRQGEIELENDI